MASISCGGGLIGHPPKFGSKRGEKEEGSGGVGYHVCEEEEEEEEEEEKEEEGSLSLPFLEGVARKRRRRRRRKEVLEREEKALRRKGREKGREEGRGGGTNGERSSMPKGGRGKWHSIHGEEGERERERDPPASILPLLSATVVAVAAGGIVTPPSPPPSPSTQPPNCKKGGKQSWLRRL